MDQRFKIMAELLPVGIFESNAAGECVFVNERWRALTGLSLDEARGHGWMRAVHPDDRADLEQRWVDTLRTGTAGTMEFRFLRGGEVVWVEANSRTLLDGAVTTGFIGTAIDITARKLAEAELRAKSEEMLHVLRSLPDGVIVEQNGLVWFANDRYAQMTQNETGTAMLGADALTHVHPDDRPPMRERIVKRGMNQTDGPSTFRLLRADGSSVPAEAFGTTILLGGRRANLAVVRDTSTRIALEKRVHQAERMASLGSLAAGVVHEVNNPLHTIILNLQQIVDRALGTRAPSASPVSIEECAGDARLAAEHIQKIVQGLSAFARCDEAERPQPVDVRRAMDTATMLARFELRHCRFAKVPSPPLRVVAIESRLVQVLVNLLVNAAQAKADDRLHEVHLLAEADGTTGFVALRVRDTGSGMEPAVQARIFEPFFTTKPAESGTGLGLAISRGMIADMGGTLDVHSEIGVGTTMSVRLPSAR